MQVRLYSDYPFTLADRRRAGATTSSGRPCARLAATTPTSRSTASRTYQGRPALRYATARRMQESCVACHNNDPDSTEAGLEGRATSAGCWRSSARSTATRPGPGPGLRETFVLMAVVSGSLLALRC